MPRIPARTAHIVFSRRRALVARAMTGLALAAAVAACADSSNPNGALSDQTPPSVMVTSGSSADSTLAFNVNAHDNLGLLQVHTQVTGPGFGGSFDTTFASAVTDVTLPYVVAVPSTVPAGTQVIVVSYAVDGARNTSKADTVVLTTGNTGPTLAVVTNPHPGDTAVVGFSVAISLSGKTPNKVRALGYIASGVFSTPVRDSVYYNSPLKDSVAVDTALSLVGATPGTLTITPFVVDSNKVLSLGAPVNVVVTSSAPGNTVPVVDFGITRRIEVTDTIHVEARDRGGVRWVGYELRNLPSDPAGFFAADSFQVNGNVSSTVHTFTMHLNINNFPKDLEVRAFARNIAGNRAYALLSDGTTIRGDTVSVVAGLTRGLPNGGTIADALYHPPTDRLYLSNIDKNELEVFDLADSTFKTPIITGSRPWGLAAWPLDRDGAMSDTLLVANSGGTTIGKVNVRAGVEFTRYPLPNIVAYSVTSTLSQTGQIIQQRTAYDFSDRPQYLAATCQGPAVGPAPCGDVVLVYSTTPTAGQSLPFANQGTVRWEDLSNRTSHFFFEQALGQTQGRADTLVIDRFAAQGFGSDSELVPFAQSTIVGTDTLSYSAVVRLDQLAFRDTTFVRNSGNFRRAIIGEGGPVLGSRAVMYDVTAGMAVDYPGSTVPMATPVIDRGVSPPTSVSDWIANSYARVGSVAINFDGELAAVRGDSTYIIDRTLRLQGLLQTSGSNPGIDFHPANAGVGPSTSPAGTRVGFAASSQPQIEVYDTYTYRRCLIIPTRDPIIGPIKSATRAGSSDVVLVGATERGVVVVTVTAAQLSSCQ